MLLPETRSDAGELVARRIAAPDPRRHLPARGLRHLGHRRGDRAGPGGAARRRRPRALRAQARPAHARQRSHGLARTAPRVIEGSFIGVDVGGTKVAAALLERGEPGESHLVKTETGSTDALLDQLVEAIEAVRADDTRAVGIGVPSVIDFATGRIRYSVNIPLADVPLRELLTDRVGLPVYVENDASCAALSEAYEGEELDDPEPRHVHGRDRRRRRPGHRRPPVPRRDGRGRRDGPPAHRPRPLRRRRPARRRDASRSPARWSASPAAAPSTRSPATRGFEDGKAAVEAAQDGDDAAIAGHPHDRRAPRASASPTRSTSSTPTRSSSAAASARPGELLLGPGPRGRRALRAARRRHRHDHPPRPPRARGRRRRRRPHRRPGNRLAPRTVPSIHGRDRTPL